MISCIVKRPGAVILYISTHGMPLVQSNLVGTNCCIKIDMVYTLDQSSPRLCIATCMLFLALNVGPYCTSHLVIVLKCVASYPSYLCCIVVLEWDRIVIVSAWHLVL